MKLTIASRERAALAARAGVAATATLLLMLPALWNRFALLEYDTGGYLARWYEGYLVPSRPAPYGLLLNLGAPLDFWPVVILQAAVTVWIVLLTMRLYGLREQPLVRLAVFAGLAIATTLPLIASVLLTDIFVGPAVLALHLLVFRHADLNRGERYGLIALAAFAMAAHSATLLLMIALGLAAGALALAGRIVPRDALARIAAVIGLGLALLLSANFVIAKKIAWTPGGYGIVFGRLLQDGFVNAYLDRHCPDPRLRLCPYRNDLPRNADVFLWGHGIFDTLGRFDGLGDEMRAIVIGSLTEEPWHHLMAAASATLRQLVSVESGEGVLDTIWHTYGMIEIHTPWIVPTMRAARQQHGEVHFEIVNLVHVPVTLAAMALLLLPLGIAVRRRRATDIELLAATVALALVFNAGILGILSNPHPRYGARIAWLAVLVVALWAWRQWGANARAPAGENRRAQDPATRGASPSGSAAGERDRPRAS